MKANALVLPMKTTAVGRTWLPTFTSVQNLTFSQPAGDDVVILRVLAAEAKEFEEWRAAGRGKIDARWLREFISVVLLLVGAILSVGATLVHLAWALPLAELAGRPAMIAAAAAMAAGALLVWETRRRAEPER